ncbi:DNA-binding domain-containing protein [Thermomonas aquatica]|uniref:DUF2063 domain-containing protein n=1 Tax=Thermomonas aquatica TaxID=2202149 RepID=A0A5B7ZRS1_9GAMM|nr:DNA-binding domain-containing protein [Thermomonas aquatica]QDA57196.1 DUF2063 domain-containing protein [Thermomonas aquatica]
MNALSAVQDAMQVWLLQGDAGIVAFVDDDLAAHRLRIYADAYVLRLLDVLGNDFPATRTALGEDAFDVLARAYIAAHPSTQPSVCHFGHAFAGWLAARTDVPRGVHELARFEWLQGECFDAADAIPLGVEAIAALPADAWPALRLSLHPATRLLATRRLRLRDGKPCPATRSADRDWLLWRAGLDVHWRLLDADEADALRALHDGAAFGELCTRLATHHGDASALRAAALLKRWLADGLLAAPDTAHDS